MSRTESVWAMLEGAYRVRTPQSRRLNEETRRTVGRRSENQMGLPYPVYMARGRGAVVYDVDRNPYLDFTGDAGALIHGHGHPRLSAAISERSAQGTLSGFASEEGIKLAQLLTKRLPSVEFVHFTSSYDEAVALAVRAARALSGRTKVLKIEGAYHGSFEPLQWSIDPGPNGLPWPVPWPNGDGLPADGMSQVLAAPFNDAKVTAQLIRTHAEELAAIVVPPVLMNGGAIAAQKPFLDAIAAATSEIDAFLILDERESLCLSPGGAQDLFGITPDITILGGLIGGGLTLGALGGDKRLRQIIEDDSSGLVHRERAHAANPAAMRGGAATLQLLTPDRIKYISQLGQQLRDGITTAFKEAGISGTATGVGSLVGIHFRTGPIENYRDQAAGRHDVQRALSAALINQGILVAPNGLLRISTPMSRDDIDRTVRAIRTAIDQIAPMLEEPRQVAAPAPLKRAKASTYVQARVAEPEPEPQETKLKNVGTWSGPARVRASNSDLLKVESTYQSNKLSGPPPNDPNRTTT